MEARLEAVKRDTFGKNEARRLRAKGHIPAVLYGGVIVDGKPQATPIAVDPKALMGILRGESGVNTLIGLKVGSEDVKVLMREYQVDPLTRRLLHVDFYRIAMDKMLVVKVPVTVKGEAKGIKQQGGLLDIVHREIEVECLPADIPESIEIDVTELMLGQAIRLRDVADQPDVEGGDRRRRHARPRRRAAHGGRAGGGGRGGGGACGGGARGHQEGQA